MTTDELQAMITSDEHHSWYRGRRRVLRAELDRLTLPRESRILDAGCGSGRTLDELACYGDATGVDLSAEAMHAAREAGHPDVVQSPVERLPLPDGAFDLVTCLDVLEHTADDRATLRELRRVTRPGGAALVTVPAYPALWSRHDERNLHFRRYTRATLRSAAVKAGWIVAHDGHFNSVLLAPAAAVRLLERTRASAPGSNLALTSPALDRVLELPLRMEAWLIARGVRLPAGLSLLAVLTNPRSAPTRLPRPVRPGPAPVASRLRRTRARARGVPSLRAVSSTG